MKRVFKGFVPGDYVFFHNILFSMLNEGLDRYIGDEYKEDGQEFKVTIVIERLKCQDKSQR